MSAEPIDVRKLAKPSRWIQLRDAANAGDKTAARAFAKLKAQQAASAKKRSKKPKRKATQSIPLHAIPPRPKRKKLAAALPKEGPVSGIVGYAPAKQRMTVTVKAGSEISVTIGGVAVTIIAVAK